MDTKNGLINFTLFAFLFVFAFVFCLDALNLSNATYGILAMIGFVVCIAGSLFNGILAKRDGEALMVWYFVYAVAVSIVTVWYMTRCGTVFGWW